MMLSISSLSQLIQRTRGISESAILIFRWALACAGSGVNKVTGDFGADINSELTRKKRNNSVKLVLTLYSSSGIVTPDAMSTRSSVYQIRLTGSVSSGMPAK